MVWTEVAATSGAVVFRTEASRSLAQLQFVRELQHKCRSEHPAHRLHTAKNYKKVEVQTARQKKGQTTVYSVSNVHFYIARQLPILQRN
ncbi:hypothetical protein M8C21_033607, partial [Ambrosia artemisiifolia]